MAGETERLGYKPCMYEPLVQSPKAHNTKYHVQFLFSSHYRGLKNVLKYRATYAYFTGHKDISTIWGRFN